MTKSLLQTIVGEVSGTLLIISSIVFFIFFCGIFPFYVFVNRANYEKDKNTPVFSITHHLYHGVIKFYICLILFCTSIASWHFMTLQKHPSFYLQILFALTAFITFFQMAFFAQVNHLILSMLSFQKFLIFLFPTTEKTISISEKWLKRVIKLLYFLCFIKDFSAIAFMVSRNYENYKGSLDLKLPGLIVGFYIFQNILLVVSAFLYIPIMIQIRKYAHLATVIESRPQKYVLYQTLITAFFKFIFFAIFIAIMSRNSSKNLGHKVAWIVIADFLTIPMIIQLSYLSCSKRNGQIMMSSIKTVMNRKFKYTSEVSPSQQDSSQNRI